MKKRPGMIRDIFSGIIGGCVFIIFSFAIKASLIVSILAAAAAFVGAMFLLAARRNDAIDVKLGAVTAKDVEKTIEEGRTKVSQLRVINRRIKDGEIRDKVEGICLAVEKIFEDFRNDPKDVKAARRFLSYYLDAAIRIIEKYEDLSSRDLDAPQIKTTLKKAEDMLVIIKEAFEKQLVRLLEDDVLDLDTEIMLLEKTIKMEGF